MMKSLSKKEYEVMSELALKNVKSITLNEAGRLLDMDKDTLKVLVSQTCEKKMAGAAGKG